MCDRSGHRLYRKRTEKGLERVITDCRANDWENGISFGQGRSMLKNYLLLAFKNFRKHRLFSAVNVLGLTIGITCCLMIFLYVIHEFSYDRWQANGDRIYRAVRVNDVEANNEKKDIAWLSPPYAKALLNDYPDAVQKAVRVRPDNDLITYNSVGFNEKKIYLVDSNFFSFFSFHLLKGDPATV